MAAEVAEIAEVILELTLPVAVVMLIAGSITAVAVMMAVTMAAITIAIVTVTQMFPVTLTFPEFLRPVAANSLNSRIERTKSPLADSRAERGRESDIYLVSASAHPHGVFLYNKKF